MAVAVILAAGAGSRLGELGKQYSKPTLPVAGRALIEWVIDDLRRAGIQHIVVVGHPSDSRLADLLRTTFPEIPLVVQSERRGIADAVRQALPLLRREEAFLACACDSLFARDELAGFLRAALQQPDAAHVAVLEMGLGATASRSAVIMERDCVTRIVEKPPPGSLDSGLVALPLYWLPKTMWRFLDTAAVPPQESYVTTCLNDFITGGGVVRTHTMTERWEITTAEDVAQLSRRLSVTAS